MATIGAQMRTEDIQKVCTRARCSRPFAAVGDHRAHRLFCVHRPAPGPAPSTTLRAQVLEENYLLIKAIIENQNLGRLQDVNT